MSTQTHPTSRTRRTPEPTTGTGKSRPAGRAIVASVVAGAVAALVLALVVFPGGTEATITGLASARVRVRLGADGCG